MDYKNRALNVKLLIIFRKVHRALGALLFLFFFIMSITGLLLGSKKHTGGFVLPKSYQGTTTDLSKWLPIDSLHKNACKILHDSVDANLPLTLERIDIRPDKGMVKFVFIAHFWGIQLDGATGQLLHIERRRSDFIENIHDGSILDYFFDTKNEQIKLVYTLILGFSLMTFTITGFWLWLGPKRMRRKRDK